MSLLGPRRRLPLHLQAEAAECGLACMAMIASYWGQHADPAALRRRFGASLRGATLRDLVGIADRLGLVARPVRVEMGELGLLRLPCVLHWDLDHFVVLGAVSRRGITIHDPVEGVRRLSLAEASRHVTGVALELAPGGGFAASPPAPRPRLREVVGRLTGLRRALGLLLLLAGAVELIVILGPLFTGLVVDHAIAAGDRGLVSTLAIAFALLLVLQVAVEALRGVTVIGLSASLKMQARANLLRHLLGLPASFFEGRPVADVLSRVGSQDAILRALTRDLVAAVLDGLTCVVTVAVMLALAPGLTGVAVAGAALYALVRWASYAPIRRASAEAIAWAAQRDGHLLETLRAVRSVKLLNAERDRHAQWMGLLTETVNRQVALDRLDLLVRSANSLLAGGLTILVVFLAARAIIDGSLSLGLLVAFLAYQVLFLRRVGALVDVLVEFRMLGLHAERLSDITREEPEPPGPPPAPPPGPRAAARPVAIEVRGLSFRHGPSVPWVLRDVSLRVEAGEWVAIAGPSGAGKTTLLKLMAGLLQPTEGTILADGVPLAEVGAEAWRSRIGVVLQDDTLFTGSIADNIAAFDPAPDRPRIEDCARLAAVHDDVAAMPMRYDMPLGDMGTVLSGGQRQRVLLARALYRRPGLLLLDEATSHLDMERERAVNAAMARMALTRIVIAHRRETIDAAGRVVTLTDGRVAVGPAGPARPGGARRERPVAHNRLPGGRRADAAGQRRGHLDRH